MTLSHEQKEFLCGTKLNVYNNPKLSPYEMRYILLADVPEVYTIHPRLNDIFNIGRIDGIIPSELIPGKIAQLKEIS